MPRENSPKSQQMRARIAAAAARIIAEDGVDDYALAKRRAARQLGAESTHALPNNEEVEDALRAHLELYEADEQEERLRELREAALEIMQDLAAYRPYLRGAVWNGTAHRFSPIELVLFTDDSKLVEIHLLDRKLSFDTAERRSLVGDQQRSIAVFKLDWDGVPVTLAIHPENDERVAPRTSAGERGNLAAVERLLDEPEEEEGE